MEKNSSKNLATVYCVNDRAHFCAPCDEEHHNQDRLLQKHKRLGIEHSPYQFGVCPIHPTDMIISELHLLARIIIRDKLYGDEKSVSVSTLLILISVKRKEQEE